MDELRTDNPQVAAIFAALEISKNKKPDGHPAYFDSQLDQFLEAYRQISKAIQDATFAGPVDQQSTQDTSVSP